MALGAKKDGQKKANVFSGHIFGYFGDSFVLSRKSRISYKKGRVSDKKTRKLIKKRRDCLQVKKKGLPLRS